MSTQYIFFYYWSPDRRPLPAKGMRDEGQMIGSDTAIKGAEWEISTSDYLNVPLSKLVETHPWPFPVEENDND